MPYKLGARLALRIPAHQSPDGRAVRLGLVRQVLANIVITEDDTTSSSRIFIKILFQELAENMGLKELNVRLVDASMQPHFMGIFPKDLPRNTRFAINFFTSIGLGGLTDELRTYLKNMPKMIMQQQKEVSTTRLFTRNPFVAGEQGRHCTRRVAAEPLQLVIHYT